MAAINVSAAQAEIVSNIAAVVAVGLVVLLVYVAISSLKTIREALGSVGPEASSDSGGGMQAVHARAAAMAASGEGQSENFRDNVVTAAYDAAYSGRALEAHALDPLARSAWDDGNDARLEDEIRYGDR